MFFQQSKAMRRMLQARERVARRNPFFASILFGANLVESKQRKTVWTNGMDVFFNPEYVDTKEADKSIEGVLLKSTLHCAMLHVSRKRYRDPKMWNDACSYPVNDVVQQYFNLPEDALLNKKFGQLAPEAVYELLQEQKKKEDEQNGKGKSKDAKGQKSKCKGGDKQKSDGKGDEDADGEPPDGDDEGEGSGGQQQAEGNDDAPGSMFEPTPEETEEAEREWKRGLSNAIEKAQKAGTMPGNLQRLIGEIFPKEKLDWKDIVRDMSRDAKAKTTRTWTRPNRRRLGNGEYMPGYGNDNIYRLVMCIDVSGSVSQSMIDEMVGEVSSLLDQDLVSNVTLISVDTKIQNRIDVSTSDELIGWKAGGGGGTDFRSAMTEVGKIQDAIGMVFLTDMCTNSFGDEPPFPAVWVNWEAHNGAVAPYGRTVSYT